jgi:hypothetical protein
LAFLRHGTEGARLAEIVRSVQDGHALQPRDFPLLEFEEPGGNNYLAAVEALVQASHHRDDPKACATSLAEAIAGAIVATLAEHWGLQHRDLWDQWYSAERRGDTPPSNVILGMTQKMKDPQVAALEREAWLEVADAFERAACSDMR